MNDPRESTTFTVNVYVPRAVGVPEITFVVMLSPGGNVPEIITALATTPVTGIVEE
jgi:hypothetical protein